MVNRLRTTPGKDYPSIVAAIANLALFHEEHRRHPSGVDILRDTRVGRMVSVTPRGDRLKEEDSEGRRTGRVHPRMYYFFVSFLCFLFPLSLSYLFFFLCIFPFFPFPFVYIFSGGYGGKEKEGTPTNIIY